jgi:uncharacterized protein (DUF2147 family)
MLQRISLIFGLLIGFAGAALAVPPSPSGYWVTANGGGVVQIAHCDGGALCGRLIGIVLDPGTAVPLDWQGQSQCGLQLLEPSQTDTDGTWHGRIINPRNGNAYQVEFHVDRRDQLHLRGYVGLPLFGETQIWHRFEGAAPTSCRLTPGQVATAQSHYSDN